MHEKNMFHDSSSFKKIILKLFFFYLPGPSEEGGGGGGGAVENLGFQQLPRHLAKFMHEKNHVS